MKIAVVGGRDFSDYNFMKMVLDSFHKLFGIDMIISGGATGADEFAYKYAIEKGITFVCYPPDPKDGFPRAYFRRNIGIVNHCEAVIAFPTKNSRGTWHTINKAKQLGKKVWIKQK